MSSVMCEIGLCEIGLYAVEGSEVARKVSPARTCGPTKRVGCKCNLEIGSGSGLGL
jgi:hypothetical protein